MSTSSGADTSSTDSEGFRKYPTESRGLVLGTTARCCTLLHRPLVSTCKNAQFTKPWGVGVLLGSVFTLSNFYRIDYHHQSCVTWANQIYNEASTELGSRKLALPCFRYGYWKVHVFWFLNWIYRSSQVCPLFGVNWVVIGIWRHSPISSKYVSLWWLFFDSHVTTHQSNIRGSN